MSGSLNWNKAKKVIVMSPMDHISPSFHFQLIELGFFKKDCCLKKTWK